METTTFPAGHSDPTLRERHDVVARLQASDIFQDYQRAFQSITGLPLVIRAAGAFQLGLGGTRRGNAFCALMAAKNKACAACLALQERLETACCDRAGTIPCFAGLHESAIPVRIGNRVIAYLQTGQVLFHAPSAAEIRKATRQAVALDASLSPAELAATYRQSRVITRIKYELMLRMLEIFATQLSTLSNQLMVKQAASEPPAMTRAKTFIAEHVTEDIMLDQVARAAGMSSFYFCKSFRKSSGVTFTEYLSRIRVESVKQLLLNPYKRVSEAAYEAGFQSLSQFNRMFSRFAGEPPSVYRDRLHPRATPGTTRAPRLVAA